MPRLNMDYSKCVIYKIVCNILSVCDVYVGSTTDFVRRKYKHKNDCCNENSQAYNRSVYKYIRDNGGWNNFTMIEIEKYPCNDSNEARARERYWYETLNARLNTRRPVCTNEEYTEYKKQYRENNRDSILKYHKQYYEENRDSIAEYRNRKYTCECGTVVCGIRNKNQHQRSKKHQAFLHHVSNLI